MKKLLFFSPILAVKWQNSCKMLDSDPSMGMDPDVKFRTFLCIHLK